MPAQTSVTRLRSVTTLATKLCEHGLPPVECDACQTKADATADPREWTTHSSEDETSSARVRPDLAVDLVGHPYS